MRQRAAVVHVSLLWSALLTTAAMAEGDVAEANHRLPPTPWVTRQMVFNIPFSVAEGGQPPLAVELYVSRDDGQRWELYARQHPEARQFQFQAQEEGSYWFASRTVHGLPSPPAGHEFRPELMVLVDLQEPKFHFEARAGPSGEVETTWEATDVNLDAKSLKVEYQPRLGAPWKAVARDDQQSQLIDRTLVGRMTWWPDSGGGAVHVRAEISDRAGNKSVVNRLVLLVGNSTTHATRPDSVPGDPYRNLSLAAQNAIAWPADNRLAADPARQTQTAAHPSPPSLPQPRSQPSDSRSWSQTRTDLTGHSGDPATDPTVSTANGNDLPAAQPEVYPQVASQFVASRVATDLPTVVSQSSEPRTTRSRRFQLDYDIDAVGPSGIRQVELWGTPDAGRTWSMWKLDEDQRTPVEVEVASDGIYGFRVVVVSNNGLAGSAPRNGDQADLWVRVDATPPVVTLTSAIFGDGERVGQLDIRWQAEDQAFGERPVSLFFSESPDGPWTTIATGLANTGQHYWPVDPRVPKQILLRIEAQDIAGNVARYQLAEPINLAGMTPSARIRGITPLEFGTRDANDGE